MTTRKQIKKEAERAGGLAKYAGELFDEAYRGCTEKVMERAKKDGLSPHDVLTAISYAAVSVAVASVLLASKCTPFMPLWMAPLSKNASRFSAIAAAVTQLIKTMGQALDPIKDFLDFDDDDGDEKDAAKAAPDQPSSNAPARDPNAVEGSSTVAPNSNDSVTNGDSPAADSGWTTEETGAEPEGQSIGRAESY